MQPCLSPLRVPQRQPLPGGKGEAAGGREGWSTHACTQLHHPLSTRRKRTPARSRQAKRHVDNSARPAQRPEQPRARLPVLDYRCGSLTNKPAAMGNCLEKLSSPSQQERRLNGWKSTGARPSRSGISPRSREQPRAGGQLDQPSQPGGRQQGGHAPERHFIALASATQRASALVLVLATQRPPQRPPQRAALRPAAAARP
jgi:hypothetical protein